MDYKGNKYLTVGVECKSWFLKLEWAGALFLIPRSISYSHNEDRLLLDNYLSSVLIAKLIWYTEHFRHFMALVQEPGNGLGDAVTPARCGLTPPINLKNGTAMLLEPKRAFEILIVMFKFICLHFPGTPVHGALNVSCNEIILHRHWCLGSGISESCIFSFIVPKANVMIPQFENNSWQCFKILLHLSWWPRFLCYYSLSMIRAVFNLL